MKFNRASIPFVPVGYEIGCSNKILVIANEARIPYPTRALRITRDLEQSGRQRRGGSESKIKNRIFIFSKNFTRMFHHHRKVVAVTYAFRHKDGQFDLCQDSD